jgi:hypothetical protein
MKEKHEHSLIQLLIATVGTAKNNNHQELLNYEPNNKNLQGMPAISGHAGICISY